MSPVKLISDKEKLTYIPDGYPDAKIYYRRLNNLERNALIRKHTNRGVTDFTKVQEEALSKMVHGWNDAFIDPETNKPVEYSRSALHHLPEDILIGLIEEGRVSTGELVEAQEKTKNS